MRRVSILEVGDRRLPPEALVLAFILNPGPYEAETIGGIVEWGKTSECRTECQVSDLQCENRRDPTHVVRKVHFGN